MRQKINTNLLIVPLWQGSIIEATHSTTSSIKIILHFCYKNICTFLKYWPAWWTWEPVASVPLPSPWQTCCRRGCRTRSVCPSPATICSGNVSLREQSKVQLQIKPRRQPRTNWWCPWDCPGLWNERTDRTSGRILTWRCSFFSFLQPEMNGNKCNYVYDEVHFGW